MLCNNSQRNCEELEAIVKLELAIRRDLHILLNCRITELGCPKQAGLVYFINIYQAL